MRLIFIRHGQSEGNAAGIIQGHSDFALTDLGCIQANATAEKLAREKIDRIATSPLLRAVQTAETVASALALPVESDPALREYDMGEASGLTGPELRQRFPHVLEAYSRGERATFPGEEGRDKFAVRIGAFLERVRESDETVVAVAHGGVISAVCYEILGIDTRRRGMFQVANCSITEFVTDRSGRLMLARHNDTCHLEGILTEADRG
jgi:broad specificity phosphatase PhoE